MFCGQYVTMNMVYTIALFYDQKRSDFVRLKQAQMVVFVTREPHLSHHVFCPNNWQLIQLNGAQLGT